MINIAVYSPMWPTRKSPGFGSFVKSFCKGISMDPRVNLIVIHTTTDLKTFKLFRIIDLINTTLNFLIVSLKKDIFYIHYLPITMPLILIAGRILRKTIIVNLHGDELTEGGLKRNFIRLSCAVIVRGYKNFHIVVPSSYFKKLVPSFLKIYPTPPIYITPSGGVPDHWYAIPMVKDLASRAGTLTVGYVGRIDSGKNWQAAFELTQFFIKYNISSKLIICGWGLEVPQMKLYGMNSKVDWEHIPGVSREHLPEIYKKIDLLVFCSSRESLGLVGLEALACGIPVVSYSGFGQATYIKHKINGYLLSGETNSDHEELAKWVKQYLKSPIDVSRKCVESSMSYMEKKVSNDLVDYLSSLEI